MLDTKIIRAFISGFVSYLVHLSTLYFLTKFYYLDLTLNNCIGFTAGVFVNFVGYSIVVFDNKKKIFFHFFSFFGLNICLLLLHTLFFLLLLRLDLHYLISQSLSSVLVFLITFFISKNFIFKAQ